MRTLVLSAEAYALGYRMPYTLLHKREDGLFVVRDPSDERAPSPLPPEVYPAGMLSGDVLALGVQHLVALAQAGGLVGDSVAFYTELAGVCQKHVLRPEEE